MLLYVGFVHHLDTRVYQPIGTISSEAADKAKWEAIIIGLPYILLALIGYILTPLFLLLAICFRKHRAARITLITLAIIFAEIISFSHLGDMWNHRVFRNAFSGVTVRSESLISAIEAYKESKGVYPDNLRSLVPDFISEIPNTGLAGYPEFEYSKADANSLFKKYELLIQTPSGGLNWDVFVYRPEGNYPHYFYGGSPELIGKWAYVHE